MLALIRLDFQGFPRKRLSTPTAVPPLRATRILEIGHRSARCQRITLPSMVVIGKADAGFPPPFRLRAAGRSVRSGQRFIWSRAATAMGASRARHTCNGRSQICGGYFERWSARCCGRLDFASKKGDLSLKTKNVIPVRQLRNRFRSGSGGILAHGCPDNPPGLDACTSLTVAGHHVLLRLATVLAGRVLRAPHRIIGVPIKHI